MTAISYMIGVYAERCRYSNEQSASKTELQKMSMEISLIIKQREMYRLSDPV